jgi:hypothetical protein
MQSGSDAGWAFAAPSRSQTKTISQPERRINMASYKVLVNDNSHYMDITEVTEHGVFASADEAVAACKKIVDDDLASMWRPGVTPADLYQLYLAWGPDPFAIAMHPDDASIEFSAWSYAKQRCENVAKTRS